MNKCLLVYLKTRRETLTDEMRVLEDTFDAKKLTLATEINMIDLMIDREEMGGGSE